MIVRAGVQYVAAIAATVVFAVSLHSEPLTGPAAGQRQPTGQVATHPKTFAVFFPRVAVPADAGIGLVRIVLTCGNIEAVTKNPDDWYVETFRPNSRSGSEWAEFQIAEIAIELSAGHGVTRLPSLRALDGVIRVTVEDPRCFDIVADIRDDLASEWKTRLRKGRLQLRVVEDR